MKLTRRDWLKYTGGAALTASLPRSLSAAAAEALPLIRHYEQPMFNLPGRFTSPVIIESVEMLKRGSNFFVRTRSKDGAVGITGTKQVEDFVAIFEHLVAPHFIGKDARDLESLVDSVYRENYKLAGIPFWGPVAYVEQSLLDLLGKTAGVPVGAPPSRLRPTTNASQAPSLPLPGSGRSRYQLAGAAHAPAAQGVGPGG